MYTIKERALALAFLIIAGFGLINLFYFGVSFLGFTPKSFSIILFVPLVVLVWMVGKR